MKRYTAAVFGIMLMVFAMAGTGRAEEKKIPEKNGPVFMGFFKGNIKEYYPNIKIRDVVLVSNSATTGIPKSYITESFDEMRKELATALKDNVKSGCSSTYAAIDNFDVSFQIFGSVNNTMIVISGNAVCFDIP